VIVEETVGTSLFEMIVRERNETSGHLTIQAIVDRPASGAVLFTKQFVR
jgi:hypothetical protein